MTEHTAPWSPALWVMSLLTTALCVGVAAWLGLGASAAPAWLPLLVLAMPVSAALFTIRGYAIQPDALAIRRLLWTTRVPLAGLESARHDRDAMRGSLRLFGNGGFYAFSGWFRSKALGSYRAFVTDPRRSVVLRIAGRHVVVSPAEPERFLQELAILHPSGAERA